jgi:protein disulfide-isomerase
MTRSAMHYFNLWLSTLACLFTIEIYAANKSDFASLWTTLPVAEALENAQKSKQPVLLYWGAVWCPPCNQLKSHVFSHPGFHAATNGFVRIYLDGDEPGAQEWAEKLNVSGYPTMLILAPAQTKATSWKSMREELRLVEFVNFEEFKLLVSAAVNANKQRGNWKKRLEQKALLREANPDEWRLLAYSWDGTETIANPDQSQVKQTQIRLQKLLEVAPTEESRGLLAARLLNLDSRSKKELVLTLTNTKESLLAARGFFVAGAMSWILTTTQQESLEVAKILYVAAQKLLGDRSLSEIDKLQASASRLEIAGWLKDKGALSFSEFDNVLKECKEIALKTEAESKSLFDRHAIVTDAAMLLAAAGAQNKAKEILTQEAARSDTPWYYQSSLALMYLEDKNFPAALEWSARARESAVGHATKIQWLVSDLVLQSKIPSDARLRQNFEAGFESWLNLAKSMPDGFSGRNALRARKVKSVLETAVPPESRSRMIAKWRKTCDMLKKEARRNCLETMK